MNRAQDVVYQCFSVESALIRITHTMYLLQSTCTWTHMKHEYRGGEGTTPVTTACPKAGK